MALLSSSLTFARDCRDALKLQQISDENQFKYNELTDSLYIFIWSKARLFIILLSYWSVVKMLK